MNWISQKKHQSECSRLFKDSHWFRNPEIISKQIKNSEVMTRPAKLQQNRDPTRPDPTRGSIRPVDNSDMPADEVLGTKSATMAAGMQQQQQLQQRQRQQGQLEQESRRMSRRKSRRKREKRRTKKEEKREWRKRSSSDSNNSRKVSSRGSEWNRGSRGRNNRGSSSSGSSSSGSSSSRGSSSRGNSSSGIRNQKNCTLCFIIIIARGVWRRFLIQMYRLYPRHVAIVWCIEKTLLSLLLLLLLRVHTTLVYPTALGILFFIDAAINVVFDCCIWLWRHRWCRDWQLVHGRCFFFF